MHKSKARNPNTPKAQFPGVPGPIRQALFAEVSRGPTQAEAQAEAADRRAQKEATNG